MSISSGQLITWADLSSLCLQNIKSSCCNIGNVNNVPTRLRTGQGATLVASTTITAAGQNPSNNVLAEGTTTTYNWYAVPKSGLISAVAESTVNSEWNTFLSNAGINARSDNLVSAKEVALTVALYQQFISYHIQPISSRRQIYNTVETQSNFNHFKYVTGAVTPKYTLTGYTSETTASSEITNSDLNDIINKNFIVNELNHQNNQQNYRCVLSSTAS